MPIDEYQLYLLIDAHFSLEELGGVCFQLGISRDNLSGETRSTKVRSLITYCERREKLPDLIKIVKQERPKAAWDKIYQAANDSEVVEEEPIELDGALLTSGEDAATEQGPPRSEEPPQDDEVADPESHLAAFIIINGVIFAALSLFIMPALLNSSSFPFVFCRSTSFNATSLSVLLLFLFHLLWRALSPAFASLNQSKDSIKLGGVGVSLKTLQAFIDAFHPWQIGSGLFWSVAAVGVGVAIVGLLPGLPMNKLAPLPKLVHFSVMVNGRSSLVSPGGVVGLEPKQAATVEAIVEVAKGVRCDWSKVNGSLTEIDGCKVVYVLPTQVSEDALSVEIGSSCARNHVSSALIVRIAD